MNRDYHQEAREIAQHLADEGHSTEARALIEAIDSGATGTEILMALRWHLQQVDMAKLAMNLGMRTKIRELIAAITAVLGG
jgi:hypothetical protein